MKTMIDSALPCQPVTGRRHHQRQNHRNRSTAERLDGYALAFCKRLRRLSHISLIYRDQPAVYPLQVEATLSYLLELRRLAGAAHRYLFRLEPEETRRIQPFGCITKLESIDYGITELLLNVAMFAQVCQAVTPIRVHLHMTIREKFLSLLIRYHDLLSQLTALAEKAHQPADEAGESSGQSKEEAQL